jgi:lipoprotein-anchoring transpeptidase ErfK/SrfK
MARIVSIMVLALLLPQAAADKRRSKAKKNVPTFNVAAINDSSRTEPVRAGSSGGSVLRLQVLLDRANFSLGEIDGSFGDGTRKAVSAFKASRNLSGDAVVDPATWKMLNTDTETILISYTITEEDVAGPFHRIPADMMKKSKLPALNYESPLEGLAEKFHSSPNLLRRLNPRATFSRTGQEILVPNVSDSSSQKAASVVVDGSSRSVTALDTAGKVVAYYPATIGSKHDPLPTGNWKILGVSRKPVFHYNPDLFWDADETHAKAKIPAGPNNPVGIVWIDISKDHFGIHGASEPSTIGRSQSHGCIRLTNWDAAELAQMVAPGTPVIIKE